MHSTGFHHTLRGQSSAHEPVLSVSFHDASQDTSNHRIRRVEIATGATTTLAGSGTQGYLDGAGGSARFNEPMAIAIDPSGTFALVAVRASPAPPPLHRATPRIASPAHAVGCTPFPSPRPTSRTAEALFAQTPPPPCMPSQDASNQRIRRVE